MNRSLTLALLLCFLFSSVWAKPVTQVQAQGTGSAEVGVFEDFEVAPGAKVEVPVQVRDVMELYAVDLTIRFDPEVLQIEDADPNQAGVQPGLATFLDVGMTLFNEVDNQTGTVRFVMSQINPSEGKSGSGNLLVLYFVGKQAGTSELTVEKAEFSTRFGEAIAVSGVDAQISVSAGVAQAVSTPIPLQDQGQIVAIQTLMPTEIPTLATVGGDAPAAEQTSVASVTKEPAAVAEDLQPADADVPTRNVEETDLAKEVENDGNAGLWIGGILFAVVLAAAGYYFFNRNRNQNGREVL